MQLNAFQVGQLVKVTIKGSSFTEQVGQVVRVFNGLYRVSFVDGFGVFFMSDLERVEKRT